MPWPAPSPSSTWTGNLLEVIWLELANDVQLVIHAMALRPTFYDLLPPAGEDTHD